jgi:soluble lytic murein transglycosylase-like protein
LRLERPLRHVPEAKAEADGKSGGDSRPFERHLWRAELRSGVSGDLLRAIIRVESNYNPRAVSSAGAKGLMQLMPLTAKLYGAKDAFDPAENIQAGAAYLRQLAQWFNGDLVLTIAAYHAGPTTISATRSAALTRNSATLLPSPVTRAYVHRVLSEFARVRAQRLGI